MEVRGEVREVREVSEGGEWERGVGEVSQGG